MRHALESSVTLEDVFAVVSTRRVPLAAELAGYLALEITEEAEACIGSIDPSHIFISEEGSVALVRPRAPRAGDTEASVRAALGRLLEAGGSQAPALQAAARRKAGAGLHPLAEELEAALIPVNRAAGRRALARLAREVRRVMQGVGRNALLPADPEGPSPAEPAPTPPGEHSTPEPPLNAPAGDAPSRIDISELPPTVESRHRAHTPRPISVTMDEPPADLVEEEPELTADPDVEPLLAASPHLESARHLPLPPVHERTASSALWPPESSAPSKTAQPRRRSARDGRRSAVIAAAGAAIACAVLGAYMLGSRSAPRSLEPADRTGARPPTAALTGSTPTCVASLQLTDVPPQAEVLRRLGRAPVDVERIPVGARVEFVALAEGYAPKRAIVPADAPWDRAADETPRYELAVQLDPGRPRGVEASQWPAGEPGTQIGGRGPAGAVHIVSSPRGADIWLLIGMGPSARLEGLACDADLELLVAGPGTLRKHLHFSASEFVPTGAEGAHIRAAQASMRDHR